jgi:hypothetical protein
VSYVSRKGFQQLEWRRGNEAVFGFDVLSTGAREQFAAALRVTMAEVLAEAYDGSLPVLFDDAFTNSDPERQSGVYRMLQKASEHGLQVISLTCDPLHVGAIQGQKVLTLGTTMTSSLNPRVHCIGQRAVTWHWYRAVSLRNSCDMISTHIRDTTIVLSVFLNLLV